MLNKIFIYLFEFLLFISLPLFAYDLTVVGGVTHSDGLGRITVGVIDLLKDDLHINCILTYLNPTDLSERVLAIVECPNKTPGKVSIMFAPLWYATQPKISENVPKNSKIKIAYSMLESTCIPQKWVTILNSRFDAVIVPDAFLVEVYKNSGVSIPIFVLPIGMSLSEFYQKTQHPRPSSPFVFGTTVSCDERKNYALLIQSFAEEFGNSDQVILKLNARQGLSEVYKNLIESLGVNNIHFTHEVLNKEKYLDFMNSFDCFINISKGEGFSLCPREAMALGIPCILSRNSAQITLCDTGFVRVVPSLIPEPANYGDLFDYNTIGNFFTCTKEDVKVALRDVYNHYQYYQNSAEVARVWVAQYEWVNLKKKYLSLIKPSRVILGEQNIITDDFLMTNSKKLCLKYKKAFKKHKKRN